MDLDLERIALGNVVGVTAAAVAAGAGGERDQQINLGEKFDEIAGPNGACFHDGNCSTEYVSTGSALRRASASEGGVVCVRFVIPLVPPKSRQRRIDTQNTASLARWFEVAPFS